MTTPKVQTTFVGSDRWYVHKDSGQEVPGVSAIKDMMPNKALENWKVRKTAEYAVDNITMLSQVAAADRNGAVELCKGASRRTAKAKADEGTDVHAMAEEVMRSIIAERKPRFSCSAEHKRYLRNFARFLQEFDVEPVMTETTVWSQEWQYAGTFDLLCRLRTIDDKLCIVDLKTGASGVYPDHSIQQTGYRWADHYIDDKGQFQPMPEVARAYALWLRPNGWALYPLDTGEKQWELFKRLRQNYDWKHVTQKSVMGKPVNAHPLKKQRKW